MSKKRERQSVQPDVHEARAGTVARQLADLLNELLLSSRKSFGMFGGTSWAVREVGPDVITVRFSTWPTGISYVDMALNVRNAMLNLLRDTVPCTHFRAVFQRSERDRATHRVELDFFPPDAAGLPSQLIVIEENVAPRRQQWRELVDRTARSGAYFTRTRRGTP